MKNIFEIDEGFDSKQDKILSYIEEVSNKDFGFDSGLIFVDFVDFETNFSNATQKLHSYENQSWGILKDEITSMIKELEILLYQFKSYYVSNVVVNEPSEHKLTPQKIHYIVNKSITRIKRLVCVLDPEYSVINFKDKNDKHYYTMIKGYWINDLGVRERSISRNICNNESSINELTIKMFKQNRNNAVSSEVKIYDRLTGKFIIGDIIVASGNSKMVVETKIQNKENFIKTYVMFEMWKKYKEQYELLI